MPRINRRTGIATNVFMYEDDDDEEEDFVSSSNQTADSFLANIMLQCKTIEKTIEDTDDQAMKKSLVQLQNTITSTLATESYNKTVGPVCATIYNHLPKLVIQNSDKQNINAMMDVLTGYEKNIQGSDVPGLPMITKSATAPSVTDITPVLVPVIPSDEKRKKCKRIAEPELLTSA